jgi:chorismate mutase
MSETIEIVTDGVLAALREQVLDLDRSIVEAFDRRLELVARIRRHKEENGLPFLDPAREDAMLRHLIETNPGPLSDEGVAELFSLLLDLTKREVSRLS